jgi:subtilisin family serine protease
MKIIIIFLFSISSYAIYSPSQSLSKQSAHTIKQFNGVTFEEVDPSSAASWIHESSDGQIQGISTKAYYKNELTVGKKIIVAVIDSGVDVNHEDLDGRVWINKKEIPNNNIDDDMNGYIDDVMGWNFIGSKEGSVQFKLNKNKKNGFDLINKIEGQVHFDSLEITRELKRLTIFKEKLQNDGKLIPSKLIKKIKELSTKINLKREDATDSYNYMKEELKSFQKNSLEVKNEFNLEEISLLSLNKLKSNNEKILKLIDFFDTYDSPLIELNKGLVHFHSILNYKYNTESDVRSSLVKDANKPQFYGNNNVIGPAPYHGTHVAGIVAASRDNNIGINGVANNAVIMPIRIVPNGDERDKDVANAILYAVDNGAKIINMSFGKFISPNLDLVFKAIKYAHSKNVLLIHSAGNENTNIDIVDNFPMPTYKNTKLNNWIEVGASDKYLKNLFADFSNFGKKNVDIFAPGVDIISTTPNNSYSSSSGTSMAAPVVSGLAAIVLGKYPNLLPNQVKNALLSESNTYPLLYSYNPAIKQNVLFSSLSRSGSTPNIQKVLVFLKN